MFSLCTGHYALDLLYVIRTYIKYCYAYIYYQLHNCQSHAKKSACISTTIFLRLSIHLAVVAEISSNWYKYPFSLDLSLLRFCSVYVGGHSVFGLAVTVSREPVSLHPPADIISAE